MMPNSWWWPWWVSTLIDLAVVALAVWVFARSSRRTIRRLAALFVLAGLVAAVMAPIVMTGKSKGPAMDRMKSDQPPAMQPMQP
jgi:putative effector of murein hydrolase